MSVYQRNAREAVHTLQAFIEHEGLQQASIGHIAAAFKRARPKCGFITKDITDARRALQSQPLTTKFPIIKGDVVPIEVRKLVTLGAQKNLPVQIGPGRIAEVPQPRAVIALPPPEPVKPPPAAVKPSTPEPRLLLAPTGEVAACTTANLSEAVDDFSQAARCDPSAIIVYRRINVRVQRLVEVTEE